MDSFSIYEPKALCLHLAPVSTASQSYLYTSHSVGTWRPERTFLSPMFDSAFQLSDSSYCLAIHKPINGHIYHAVERQTQV